MTPFFYLPLAMIARATDRGLAKHIQFLKEENKGREARILGVIRTSPDERERLLKFGKASERAIEELLIIVCPSTFYRWLRSFLSRRQHHFCAARSLPAFDNELSGRCLLV